MTKTRLAKDVLFIRAYNAKLGGSPHIFDTRSRSLLCGGKHDFSLDSNLILTPEVVRWFCVNCQRIFAKKNRP